MRERFFSRDAEKSAASASVILASSASASAAASVAAATAASAASCGRVIELSVLLLSRETGDETVLVFPKKSPARTVATRPSRERERGPFSLEGAWM